MRIALCQRTIINDNKKANLKETKEMLERAVQGSKSVDLVMFPEYNYGEVLSAEHGRLYAETLEGEYVSAMKELAQEYHVNLIPGSFAEKAERDLSYNTMVFINREGKLLDAYRKIHLADSSGAKESELLKAGNELKLVNTDCGKIGLMICYDMRFPELARSLVLAGADLICMCSCWPIGRVLPSRDIHWDTLTKATALYNLTYFAACNVYGEVRGSFPFGYSRVVDPWGSVIACCSSGTQIVYADLDFEYQSWARNEAATWNNRRPECYKL